MWSYFRPHSLFYSGVLNVPVLHALPVSIFSIFGFNFVRLLKMFHRCLSSYRDEITLMVWITNSNLMSLHHLTSGMFSIIMVTIIIIILFTSMYNVISPFPFQTDMWARLGRSWRQLHNVMTISIIWHNRDDSVIARLHKQPAVLASPSPRLDRLRPGCWRRPAATRAPMGQQKTAT